MKAQKGEMIKITNEYLDAITTSPVIAVLVKKEFTTKTSYWLAKIFDKLSSEARIFATEKNKLIEKYALRHEKDGEERECGADGKEKKDGKIIRSWKKGDIVSDGRSTSLADVRAFAEKLKELTDIEIDIKIKKIEFDLDKEVQCTVEEMALLFPLIDVKE